MEHILLVIQIIISLALIGIVLIQRSDNDGMGLGGGGGGLGLLSGRAKANALTRTTAILAVLFMLNSLLFTVVSTAGRSSIIEQIETQKKEDATAEVPLATEPAPSMADKIAPEEVPSEAAPAQTPAEPANDNEPQSVPRAD
jgi:preprotein translocase subunit SecG